MSIQHASADRSRSLLARAASGGALLRLTGTALGLVLMLLLARYMGPKDYGRYSLVIAIATLVTVPIQAGLPTLVVRDTARNLAQGNSSRVTGLWLWSVGVVLVYTAVSAILAWWLVRLGDSWQGGGGLLVSGLVLLGVLSLNILGGSMLSGARRVILGQVPDQLLRPLSFLAGLIVHACWVSPKQAAGVSDVIGLFTAAGLANIAVTATLVARFSGVRWGHCDATLGSVRTWTKGALVMSTAAGLLTLNSQMDILVLGALAGPEAVGVYRVAAQFSAIVSFPLLALNLALAPNIARLYETGARDDLQRLVIHAARLALGIAFPIALLLVLAGGAILGVGFGEGYREGYAPLVILVLGQVLNVAMGSVGLLLNMTGHERDVVIGAGIALATNLPLNLALIPFFGMSGAALATSVSVVVWNVYLYRSVRRKLGVSIVAFDGGK